MAFRILRQRKEARRLAKIEEIFQERDRAQRGKLSLEQLQDIFRIYQVELEPRAVSRVLDQEEEITREDFVKLATETKLTEFQERDRSVVRDRGGGERKENLRLLCCVGSEERNSSDRSSSQERLRQIERAFNKFDLNGDGFLSWEEFLQIGLDRETASRIFSACSKEEQPGRISLDQFQSIATKLPGK